MFTINSCSVGVFSSRNISPSFSSQFETHSMSSCLFCSTSDSMFDGIESSFTISLLKLNFLKNKFNKTTKSCFTHPNFPSK